MRPALVNRPTRLRKVLVAITLFGCLVASGAATTESHATAPGKNRGPKR
jgi:hypothetical protein